MGDGQYFMRVRGRIMGPFDQEKLQGLTRRGQLSRLHEVSTDGITWARASTFPELFVIVPSQPLAEPSMANPAAPDPEATDRPGLQTAPQPTVGSQPNWFYVSAGQQCGPVDFSSLQLLAARGQLGAEDMVWTNNMASWMVAGQVPGLIQALTRVEADRRATSVSDATGDELLPAGLCDAATNSRPWVLFVAITGYGVAALLVIGGLLLIIAGAKTGSAGAPGIFTGLTDLILAAIVVAGSVMLSGYAGRLAALSHSQNPIVLEKALLTLRQFWIFVAINLIVWLAFVAAFFVLVFSSVIALPTF